MSPGNETAGQGAEPLPRGREKSSRSEDQKGVPKLYHPGGETQANQIDERVRRSAPSWTKARTARVQDGRAEMLRRGWRK